MPQRDAARKVAIETVDGKWSQHLEPFARQLPARSSPKAPTLQRVTRHRRTDSMQARRCRLVDLTLTASSTPTSIRRVSAQVAIDVADLQRRILVRLGAEDDGLLRELLGGEYGGEEDARHERLRHLLQPVVWHQDGSELLVDLASVRCRLVPGWLVASLVLGTDQTGRAEVKVIMALGRADRGDGPEAGVTLDPSAPELIARRWGPSLVDAVWNAVLDVLEAAAAQAGSLSGLPITVTGFFADEGELVAQLGA